MNKFSKIPILVSFKSNLLNLDFFRTLEEYNTYVVVLNLGTEYEIINLHGQIPNLRVFLKVLIASENSGYKKG